MTVINVSSAKWDSGTTYKLNFVMKYVEMAKGLRFNVMMETISIMMAAVWIVKLNLYTHAMEAVRTLMMSAVFIYPLK